MIIEECDGLGHNIPIILLKSLCIILPLVFPDEDHLLIEVPSFPVVLDSEQCLIFIPCKFVSHLMWC